MLPKPEKIKNLKSNPEQLDMVDALSKEKKLKNKRRYVLIFLILTVGLSFGFWMYRTCRYFFSQGGFSQISFNLPNLTISSELNKSSPANYQKDILNLIGDQKESWSIYIETIQTNKTPFAYSLNSEKPSNFNQIANNLSHQPISQNSLTQQSLPSAVQIQEISTSQNQNFELNSLIIIPQKQILLIIKTNNLDINQVKKKIPSIIEIIYWQILNSN